MAVERGVAHVTEPVAAVAARLPHWATLVRAPNPGPLTLDGTNTWVLRAADAASTVVIDPGPAHEDHLQAVAAHGPVAAVLVTHCHPDHMAGVARFHELTGVTPLPPAELRAGRQLAGLRVTALPTPGHTADSVTFLVEGGGEQAVLTGDTILGRGTTVVAWPDGNLGDYLASLTRLVEFAGVPVLPGHGPALADCGAAASYYLAHRRARLDQVRSALAAGATTPSEIVSRVYPDLDQSLVSSAELSVRAQLAYLRDSARAGGQPGPEDAVTTPPSPPLADRESPPGPHPLDEP